MARLTADAWLNYLQGCMLAKQGKNILELSLLVFIPSRMTPGPPAFEHFMVHGERCPLCITSQTRDRLTGLHHLSATLD